MGAIVHREGNEQRGILPFGFVCGFAARFTPCQWCEPVIFLGLGRDGGLFFSCRDYSVVSGLTLCSTFFERLIEARIGCHFDRKFRDLGSDYEGILKLNNR